MSRKKPTIKELASLVAENRQGLEAAYNRIDELKFYCSGLDKILDWYITFKDDVDGFRKYIEDEKTLNESEKDNKQEDKDDSNRTKGGLPDKQQDLSKRKSSDKPSKRNK